MDSIFYSQERVLSCDRVVIAVGGRPNKLDCEGGDLAISSDDLFSLKKPPGRTLIIGASYVALECAGAKLPESRTQRPLCCCIHILANLTIALARLGIDAYSHRHCVRGSARSLFQFALTYFRTSQSWVSATTSALVASSCDALVTSWIGFLTGLGIDTTVMVRSIVLRGFDQGIAERVRRFMEAHGTRFVSPGVPHR